MHLHTGRFLFETIEVRNTKQNNGNYDKLCYNNKESCTIEYR